MPKLKLNDLPTEITETGVTIDHDTHEIWVDTNLPKMATIFKKLGFVEITEENSKPYRRFKGKEDQLMLRNPIKSNMSQEQRKIKSDMMSRLRKSQLEGPENDPK